MYVHQKYEFNGTFHGIKIAIKWRVNYWKEYDIKNYIL